MQCLLGFGKRGTSQPHLPKEKDNSIAVGMWTMCILITFSISSFHGWMANYL